ncbi:MAG: antitoxin Xre/MbcA/ParS toxin-binding domain-containing protein [Trueperaceae bacterium]
MAMKLVKHSQDAPMSGIIGTFETQTEAAAFLDISPRTLLRRLETQEFEMGERLKLEMLSSVHELALQTFSSEEAAIRWLKMPRPSLDNKTPLQLLDSVLGYERIKSELIGHVYGMF